LIKELFNAANIKFRYTEFMSTTRKFAVLFLIINLLALNAIVGFLLYQELINKPQDQVFSTPSGVFQDSSEEDVIVDSGCGEDCMAYINQAINQLTLSRDKEEEETQPIQPAPSVQKTAKTKRVSYVPVPGSGSTLENDWTDIAGTDFYLAKVDYPGFLEAYFEATFKLINGNGIAYIRLFDATHSIAVQGSEVSTSSQTSTFVSSGKISLWEGANLYRVQAKSLTADTTVFESARLKIIAEN
jgi:hypothetical protein